MAKRRKLVWSEDRGTEGWACSYCGWVGPNQRSAAVVKTVSPDLRETFNAHACVDHPRGAINVKPSSLRVFRWLWVAFIVLGTTFPYLWNFVSKPPGHRYTWILPPYPEDSFGYMAWSEQAANGALLFKVKYTAIPQSPFLFNPFFLICGWLARSLACDIGIIHLVVKEIGVVLFFLVFYRYTDYLRLNRFQSLVSSVLVGVSSGVGGLFGLFGPTNKLSIVPADLWMPEVSTYWSLLWNPLFPYSLLLILLTIYYLDRGTRESRRNDLWIAGFAAGVLVLVHPYSQPLLLMFALCIVLVRRRLGWLGYFLRYLSGSLPFLIYVGLVSVFQPVLAQHSSQGIMRSPDIRAYALGFGLPLLLLVLGFGVKSGRWMKQYWQVVLWFVLAVVLAYFPWWFQRKLIFGAHIPLCILAAISFDLILAKCSRLQIRKWLFAGAAVILFPLVASTSIYLLVSERREARDNNDGTYFMSNEMVDGLKFLKSSSKPEEVVFATTGTSSIIPGFSGNTVVWGHWAMSVDFSERKDWYTRLFKTYQNWDDDRRSSEFWGSGIEYVFADSDLKTEIEQEPIKWSVILKDADEIFRNGTVVIYKHRTGQSHPAPSLGDNVSHGSTTVVAH